MNTDSNRQKRLAADLEEEIREAEQAVTQHHREWQLALAKTQALKAALAALAAPRIAHGDVKPENVVVADGKASRVLDYLRRSPGADFGVIAKEVYGEDNEKTRHNVRALINFLYRKGRIHSTARGRWVALSNSEDVSDLL